MLEFEIAALYYFVAGILNLPAYFDEVPEDMEIPCVFYPSPHQKSGDFSTNTYATTFTLYAKVMDIDNVSAGGKCSQIVHAISGNRYKVPLVDEKGKRTGNNFRIDSMEATKADEGVCGRLRFHGSDTQDLMRKQQHWQGSSISMALLLLSK